MLTYINDKQMHLKDRMSSLVLELFWVIGKFPGRPYVAVIDMGGFWLGHLAMIKENDLVLRKIEKWWFFTSEQVRGFCVQNPFQWPVTTSSLDCHCYKSGSPPVLNIEWENRWKSHKKCKKWTALRNRVWLTHQGRMSPRPFLTSQEPNGMVYFGRRKTLLYIQKCKLT